MPSQKVSKKVLAKKTTQKGGAKTATKAAAPKVTKAAAPKVTKAAAKVTKVAKTVAQKAGSKKVAAKAAAAPKAAAPKAAAPEVSKKSTRSFKVQLPGEEVYTGRYTGSTPYQAANKALSKYFRTCEAPKSVITFSIRESTRGSKHNVYTYEGHRIKLDEPVSYTIGDGNTITKHHKNQLKKVKKCDLEKKENL